MVERAGSVWAGHLKKLGRVPTPQPTPVSAPPRPGGSVWAARLARMQRPTGAQAKAAGMVGPSPYDALIYQAAQRYRLNPNILRSMVQVESGFNAKAKGAAGEMGLMQLMPGTARGLGVQNPWDPGQNIDGGARYLRQQLDRFGNDYAMAVAAYNAGPGRAAQAPGIPLPTTTQGYVQKVLSGAQQRRAGAPPTARPAVSPAGQVGPVALPGAPRPQPAPGRFEGLAQRIPGARPYLGPGGGWAARLPQPVVEAGRLGLAALQQPAYGVERAIGRGAQRYYRDDPFERLTPQQQNEVGRVVYSWFGNPVKMENIARRLGAGEEMETVLDTEKVTWRELAGQLLLDPLNLIGFVMGKAKRGKEALAMVKALDVAMEPAQLGMRGPQGIERVARGLITFWRDTPKTRMLKLGDEAALVVDALTMRRGVSVGAADEMVDALRRLQAAEPFREATALTAAGQRTGHVLRLAEVDWDKGVYFIKDAKGKKVSRAFGALKDLASGEITSAGEFRAALIADMRDLGRVVGRDVYEVPALTFAENLLTKAKQAMSMVFMGYNPGYAVRGVISNEVIPLLHGKAAWSTPANQMKYLSQFYGEGPELEKVIRTLGIKRGIGAVGERVGAPATAIVQRSEAKRGIDVFMSGHREGMRAGPGIVDEVLETPAWRGLLEEADALRPGTSEQVARALRQARTPDEAHALLHNLLAEGKPAVGMFTDTRGVSPAVVEAFQLALDDAPTIEDALRAVDDVPRQGVKHIRQVTEAGEQVVGQGQRIAEELRQAGVGEEIIDVFNAARQSERELIQAAKGRAWDAAEATIEDAPTNLRLMRRLEEALEQLNQRTFGAADEFRARVWQENDAIRARPIPYADRRAQLDSLWENYRVVQDGRFRQRHARAVRLIDTTRGMIDRGPPAPGPMVPRPRPQAPPGGAPAMPMGPPRVGQRPLETLVRAWAEAEEVFFEAAGPPRDEAALRAIGDTLDDLQRELEPQLLQIADELNIPEARDRGINGLLHAIDEVAPGRVPSAPLPTAADVSMMETVEVSRAAEEIKQGVQQMGRRPLTRSWRAGMNQGTVEFASQEQQLLYDAYAGMRRARRAPNMPQAQATRLMERASEIKRQLGIVEDVAFDDLAQQVYEDVRAQMRGLADGETRRVADNVSGPGLADWMTGAEEDIRRAAATRGDIEIGSLGVPQPPVAALGELSVVEANRLAQMGYDLLRQQEEMFGGMLPAARKYRNWVSKYKLWDEAPALVERRFSQFRAGTVRGRAGRRPEMIGLEQIAEHLGKTWDEAFEEIRNVPPGGGRSRKQLAIRLAQEAEGPAPPEEEILFRLATVPEELLARFTRQMDEDLAPALRDLNYAATQYGLEIRRQTLLDYSYRTNFDWWLQWLYPYQFWYTRTGMNMGKHMMTRPGKIAAYYRLKQGLEDVTNQPGFPTRLKGKVKIRLPFLPDWMGDELFIDPLRTLTPIPTFTDPYMPEYEDETGLAKLYRRAGAIMSPAPWLTYPLAASGALGERERWITGPQIPLARGLKGVTGLLGVGPAGGVSLAPVRRAMGLPAGETWDPYRVDRMLSNMAQEGMITVAQAKQAAAMRSGPIYEQAQRRAGQERGVTLTGSMLGMSGLGVYPTGERETRRQRGEELYPALEKAAPGFTEIPYAEREAWRAANPAADERIRKVYTEFYERNPEQEAYSFAWQAPRERLIDMIWDSYMERGAASKREVREALGDKFRTFFLDKDSRDTTRFTDQELTRFAQGLGWGIGAGVMPRGGVEAQAGAPVGTAGELGPSPRAVPEVPPQIDEDYQAFLDQIAENFPADIREVQSQYFALPERSQQRRSYLVEHPELQRYWEWSRDYKRTHPQFAQWYASIAGGQVPGPAGAGAGGYAGRAIGSVPSLRPGPGRFAAQRRGAAGWEGFLGEVGDSSLRGLIRDLFAQHPSQRLVFARRFPQLLAWLRAQSKQTLARLQGMHQAWLAERAYQQRRAGAQPQRMPRQQQLRWYTKW